MNATMIANRFSAIPGVGLVIGASTILLNLIKIIIDCVKINFFYYKSEKLKNINSAHHKEFQNKYFQCKKEQSIHLRFLCFGFVRAIPIASCYLWNYHPPREFIKIDGS